MKSFFFKLFGFSGRVFAKLSRISRSLASQWEPADNQEQIELALHFHQYTRLGEHVALQFIPASQTTVSNPEEAAALAEVGDFEQAEEVAGKVVATLEAGGAPADVIEEFRMHQRRFADGKALRDPAPAPARE